MMDSGQYARLEAKIDTCITLIGDLRVDLAAHLASNGHKSLEQLAKRTRSLEFRYYAVVAGFVAAFILLSKGVAT